MKRKRHAMKLAVPVSVPIPIKEAEGLTDVKEDTRYTKGTRATKAKSQFTGKVILPWLKTWMTKRKATMNVAMNSKITLTKGKATIGDVENNKGMRNALIMNTQPAIAVILFSMMLISVLYVVLVRQIEHVAERNMMIFEPASVHLEYVFCGKVGLERLRIGAWRDIPFDVDNAEFIV